MVAWIGVWCFALGAGCATVKALESKVPPSKVCGTFTGNVGPFPLETEVCFHAAPGGDPANPTWQFGFDDVKVPPTASPAQGAKP